MPWSIFEMVYLAIVVVGFGSFIAILGVTAILCNSRRAAPEAEKLHAGDAPLKAHGDKLAHSVDFAA